VSRIAGIVKGNRAITALRLVEYEGTTPDMWINLQANYEARSAESYSASADCNSARNCSRASSAYLPPFFTSWSCVP